MKKLLMICAVIIGFAFTASAQTDNKPEFKFNEEKHDFGKIPQGTPVTTVFEFTNVGVGSAYFNRSKANLRLHH